MSEVVEVYVTADPAIIEFPADDAPTIIDVFSAGPQGPAPVASRYDARVIAPVAGVLTIDLSIATSFLVDMTGNVTSIVFENAPPDDKAQGVFLYFRQDATGGRTVDASAWPTGRRAPAGIPPALSAAPNAIDIVVVNAAFAAFGLVTVTQVARNYLPF